MRPISGASNIVVVAAPGRKRKSGFSNFNGFDVRYAPDSGR